MQTWWAYGIVKDGIVLWADWESERLSDEWVATVLRNIRGSGVGLVIMEGPSSIDVPLFDFHKLKKP